MNFDSPAHMRPLAPRLILLALIIMTLLSATVLLCDATAAQHHERMSKEFQTLVGGLGYGPALGLSQRAYRFDPRLCGDSMDTDGPLPRSVAFGARDPFSIFPSAPLSRSSFVLSTEE